MRDDPDGSGDADAAAFQDQDPPYLLPGFANVGAYVVEAAVGSGGFGIVYRARHQTLNRVVALKEYFPKAFATREGLLVRAKDGQEDDYAWGLERFIAEAQNLARFKHPSIIEIFDVFSANETAYIVLAFEDGKMLEEWCRGRSLSEADFRQLVLPLLDAIELLHDRGFLHRDIAPDNILVRRDGSPVLVDFGIAKFDPRLSNKPTTIVVKEGYSPLEQYKGAAPAQGPWSDIYSLAATLYYLVTGLVPAPAHQRSQVKANLWSGTEPAMSVHVLQAIERGLEPDHTQRFQSIREFRNALFPDLATSKVRTGIANRRRVSLLLGGLLLVGLTGLAFRSNLICPGELWQCSRPKVDAPGADAIGPEPQKRESAEPTLNLEIQVGKTRYAVGDELRFQVAASHDCYFLIYNIDGSGAVDLHVPAVDDKFMGPPLLRGGEDRKLPVSGVAVVNPPVGLNKLGFLCSKRPLDEAGLTTQRLLEQAQAGRTAFEEALDVALRAQPGHLNLVTTAYDVR